MGKLEQFVINMETMCKNSKHGYDQQYRWGEYGDYDCSSAIITALRKAGFDTGNATYTGNMSRELCARGFIRLSPSTPKRRGDILLNDVNHVACYLGNNLVAEFSINEKGGVRGGRPGDQTGNEAGIRLYYNYPWNCILRYTKESISTVITPSTVNFTYAVKAGGKIYDEVVNLSDYAGVKGVPITDIAIKVDKGSIWYQVHVVGGGWLPKVTGYDWNDYSNGYAGNGTPIDAVRVYYYTPDDIVRTSGYQKAQYHVSPVGKSYYPWQYDDDTTAAQDGYAGSIGTPIDRFQLF